MERFVPDEAERARLNEFVAPAEGLWPDEFDAAQTEVLLRGFPRGELEDKWVVYTDEVSADGRTTVHFHRSWTGLQVVSVDLELTATGSRCILATWETDDSGIATPTEQFARETFREVCRTVLGMPAADAQHLPKPPGA